MLTEKNRLYSFILLSAIAISCLIIYTNLYEIGRLYIDDTFITLRYSENFANGKGLVFNSGEHVFGTTTPLYALILGALKFFCPSTDLYITSQFISISFFALSILYLSYKNGSNIIIATLLLLFLIMNGINYPVIFSGMETGLVLFFLLFMIFRIDQGCISYLVIVLLLFRIDIGIVFTAVLITFNVLKFFFHKEKKIKFLALVTGLIISTFVYILVTYLLFDSVIPNTILAKNVLYKDTIFQQSFKTRLDILMRMGFNTFVSLPILFFNLAFFVLKLRKRKLTNLGFDLFYYFYFFFLLFAITRINEWYVVYLIVLTGANFFVNLDLLIKEYSLFKKNIFNYAPLVIIALISIFTFKSNNLLFKAKESVYNSELYKISSFCKVEDKIFCGDIGVIGFYGKCYLYDYAGLVTPRAIPFNKDKTFYPLQNGFLTSENAILSEIKKESPSLVNFRKSYPFVEGVINESFFKENYMKIFDGNTEVLYRKN